MDMEHLTKNTLASKQMKDKVGLHKSQPLHKNLVEKLKAGSGDKHGLQRFKCSSSSGGCPGRSGERREVERRSGYGLWNKPDS